MPSAQFAPLPSGGAAIASVGVSVPANVVSNAEIGARLGVHDDWIVRRTGIRSRRIARPTSGSTRTPRDAARQALARAGIDPLDVDLVLVATTTADELMPTAAPLVAHAIGATRAGRVRRRRGVHRLPLRAGRRRRADRGRPRRLRGRRSAPT